MNRIIVVDDEPRIVDWLFQLISSMDKEEFDVYKAYSAYGALKLLDRTKIDIVVSDIHMPGMDGLQLLKEIRSRWPECKVIFLTGYNEFEYVYTAIHNEGVEYILKTEKDQMILDAIYKAAKQINDELKIGGIIKNSKEQIMTIQALYRKEYIMNVIRANISPNSINNNELLKFNIPLRAELPLLILMAKVDSFIDLPSHELKIDEIAAIDMVVNQFIKNLTVNINVQYDKATLIWIMQPKDNICLDKEIWKRVTTYVKGIIETVQNIFKDKSNLSFSFIVTEESVLWQNLSQKIKQLNEILYSPLGFGKQMILTDMSFYGKENEKTNGKVKNYYTELDKLTLFQELLDKGQKLDFNILLNDILTYFESISSLNYSLSLEIYYSLSLFFLYNINKKNLYCIMQDNINLQKLFKLEDHKSVQDILNYFNALSDALFESQAVENINKNEVIMLKIQKYIKENLKGDLSLVRLAEVVYLNPIYLSKLYKQVTGKNLSDYICETKISVSKKLLSNKSLKINEVGAMLGFESPAYFTRFFKRNTSMTPQEYRGC